MKGLQVVPILVVLALAASLAGAAGYRTSIGAGADEIPVVVLSGTPYEMGYSYGNLMAAEVNACMAGYLAYYRAEDPVHFSDANLDAAWAAVEPYVDTRFVEEMQGLADGAAIDYLTIRRAHSISLLEDYACSGVALWGAASANGHLYQIRNLDYTMGAGIQNYPAIVVYVPTTGVAHATVACAGYIGAVAGLNARGIAVTEMGDTPGSEYPFNLNGIPWFVMLRDVLQDAPSLNDALTVISTANRIKKYHYVIGDGDEPAGVKLRAWAPGLDIWTDNDPADELFPNVLPEVVYETMNNPAAWSHLNANYGAYDAGLMIELSRLVHGGGNLMDVVYDATARQMWVACAEGAQPAYQREYVHFDLTDYVFQDDFEDAGYTADSWFIWSPTWQRVLVPGGMAFEGCGGSAPPNVGPEALACAARGRSFMVDGLYVRASLSMVSLGGGITFGANECVAEVPPLRDATYQTYYVAVSPLIGGIELHEIGSGFDNVLAAASIPGLSYDMWYDLELVSTDTNFQVWFGLKGGPLDKVIDVAQDVLHPGTQTYLSGLVDLWVENSADTDSRIQFDDFVVEGIEEAARSMMTGNVGTIPGTPASVSMSVTDAEGVAGFQFDLYYHTGWLPALIAPYVEKGSLIASDPSWQVSYSVLGPGHISVLGSNTLAQPLPPGAWGELARMWFQVNPGLSNEAALLDIENATLSDRYGDPIAVKPYDGLAYIKEAPLTFLDPGYSASVFYSGIPRPDGIAPQPDGSLLVVQENDPSGVVLAREGDTYDLGDAYSTLGNPFTGPDDIVLGPDGIAYVSNGYPIQGILKVLPGGGEPAWLAPSPPVTDAYGLAFAPPGFLGPNVKPGDLLIADNGLGNPAWWGLFSADLSTGEVRKIAGNFENGPLQVEVGPDGIVYVAENDDPRNGYSIDVVAPNGTVTPLLANFDMDGVPDEMDRGPMAANPVTNKLYFADSNSGNMWVLDNGVPRLFAWGLDEPQNCAFSADGSTLFVSEISSHRIIRIDGFGPRHLSAAHRVGVPGSAVSVPIALDNADGIAAVQFDLVYDPAILTNAGAQKGALIAADPNWTLVSNVITPGRIRVIAYNQQAQPLGPGSGTIVECTFTVSSSAARGQTSPLDIQDPVLSDTYGNSIPVAGVDGSVQVIAVHHFAFDPISSPQGGDATHPLPFAVTIRALDQNGEVVIPYGGTAALSDLTGSVQPTSVGPFVNGLWTGDVTIGASRQADVLHVSEPEGAAGDSNPFDVIQKADANADFAINVLDVMKTVNIILGNLTPPAWQYWAADCNSDDEVNVQDIILIINKIFSASGAGGAQPLTMSKASAQGSAGPVTVDASWGTSASGNPVMAITLSSAAGVAGAQVDIAYSTKRVRGAAVRGGSLIAGNADWSVYGKDAGGKVRGLCYSGSARGLAGGKGLILEIEFTATGKGNLAEISDVVLTDSAGNRIPARIGGGKPGRK